jgi:hypothetical protein
VEISNTSAVAQEYMYAIQAKIEEEAYHQIPSLLLDAILRLAISGSTF